MSIRMWSVAVLCAGTFLVNPLLGDDKESKPAAVEAKPGDSQAQPGDKETKPGDKAAKSATHDGKIVSCSNEKLVMVGKDGKEHSHELTTDSLLTLDGKPCKALDLKEGTKIRVTTVEDDAAVACRVEAIDTMSDYPAISHVGKVVSVDGAKLTMTDLKGNQEHSCMISENVKVTCDGEACKLSELKPGTKIRVCAESASPTTPISVEAIEKNPDFADDKKSDRNSEKNPDSSNQK